MTRCGAPGNGIKNQENNETRISPRILLILCRTILFGPMGSKKTNLYFLPIGRNKIFCQ